MAKNAKVIVAAVVVILASGGLAAAGLVPAAAGVLVLGLAGVGVLYRQGAGDEADAGGKSKLDRALEDRVRPSPSSSPVAPSTPAGPVTEGLPTWRPTGAPATPPAARAEPEAPAAPAQSWETWEDRGPAEDLDDENPLSDLDRLDEIDPIAEVERIEGRTAQGSVASSPSATFSFSSAPSPIDETAVQTPDDVMAASEATELHVADGEDSELARLLAKVQQRLAAYE